MGIFSGAAGRMAIGAGVGALGGGLLDGNNRGAGILGGALLGAGGGFGAAKLAGRRVASSSTAAAIHTMVGTVTDESFHRARGMALKSRLRNARRGIVPSNSGFGAFSRRFN